MNWTLELHLSGKKSPIIQFSISMLYLYLTKLFILTAYSLKFTYTLSSFQFQYKKKENFKNNEGEFRIKTVK